MLPLLLPFFLPPHRGQQPKVRGETDTTKHHPSPTTILITLMNLHRGCQFYAVASCGDGPIEKMYGSTHPHLSSLFFIASLLVSGASLKNLLANS